MFHTAISQHKEMKRIQIGKEEVKLSLFADDMMLCMGNPKESTPELLDLVSESGRVVGYRINAQRSLAFLCTGDELAEGEVGKAIPFTVASRK